NGLRVASVLQNMPPSFSCLTLWLFFRRNRPTDAGDKLAWDISRHARRGRNSPHSTLAVRRDNCASTLWGQGWGRPWPRVAVFKVFCHPLFLACLFPQNRPTTRLKLSTNTLSTASRKSSEG